MKIIQGSEKIKIIDKKYSCLFKGDITPYLPYGFFESKRCSIMDKITLEYFLEFGISMVKNNSDSARGIISRYMRRVGMKEPKKISLDRLGSEIKRSGSRNLVYFYDSLKYVRLFFDADLEKLFFEAFSSLIDNNVVFFTDSLNK